MVENIGDTGTDNDKLQVYPPVLGLYYMQTIPINSIHHQVLSKPDVLSTPMPGLTPLTAPLLISVIDYTLIDTRADIFQLENMVEPFTKWLILTLLQGGLIVMSLIYLDF